MASIDYFFEQFVKELQFARSGAGVGVLQLQQPKIATDLPQAEQGRQHNHPAPGQALSADGFEHFLAAGVNDALVNGALLLRQVAEGDLFQLLREVLRNFRFQPPQNERAETPREATLRREVLAPDNRAFIAIFEVLG